jgi:hypothetical protein
LGCASHSFNEINSQIEKVNEQNVVLNRYSINPNSLVKTDEGYAFVSSTSKGLGLFFLNDRYQPIKEKTICENFSPKKLAFSDKRFYLLGYDEKKQKTALLTLNSKGRLISKTYYGKKFDIPIDLFVKNGKPIILTDAFRKNTDLEIFYGDEKFLLKEKHNLLGKFVRPFNGGILILASIQRPEEDLYIAFLKNGKIKWKKTINFGMQDEPIKVEIKNGFAVISVISTDFMGASKYFTLKINENGKILKIKKELQNEKLPLRFRT